MKLIIQIPCFNEEATLAATVAELPREIAGIDQIEVLVVDDGSRDRTVAVARECGVDHVVRHSVNKGLARAFRTGLDACLRLGADIIVNTDADNQYAGADVEKLVAPILAGRAEVVVGERNPAQIDHYTPTKRILHRVGTLVVRRLSRLPLKDPISGFRALTRQAALEINIVSEFSYTIEMVVQAGRRGIALAGVPVRTNPKTRESRLFHGPSVFVRRSAGTVLRIFSMYRPLAIFSTLGLSLLAVGLVPITRFLYFYFTVGGAGHIQSLILGGTLLTIGVATLLIGLVADLIAFNRKLLEQTLEKVRRMETALDTDPEE